LSQALLATESLSCERGDRRLFTGVNFSLKAGEALRIAGANGAGKTTLLRAVVGLSQHYDGQVSWRGSNIQAVKTAYLSQLLYLGHAPGVKPLLSPLENLRWWAKLHLPEINDEAVLMDALAQVGLTHYLHSPCVYLSAGQQRRIALARLFLSRQLLWVLDEPFTAIDASGVALLEQQFEKHLGNGGIVLLTTHQPIGNPKFGCIDLDAYAA
jgi:heme exporter protein A